MSAKHQSAIEELPAPTAPVGSPLAHSSQPAREAVQDGTTFTRPEQIRENAHYIVKDSNSRIVSYDNRGHAPWYWAWIGRNVPNDKVCRIDLVPMGSGNIVRMTIQHPDSRRLHLFADNLSDGSFLFWGLPSYVDRYALVLVTLEREENDLVSFKWVNSGRTMFVGSKEHFTDDWLIASTNLSHKLKFSLKSE
ncbi:MAG TPA: hypothetical protein VKZ53_26290 [Candidatus Angelobacter sp.]|nr:hypothetical protein [Candidatus Angelobacter sp.]